MPSDPRRSGRELGAIIDIDHGRQRAADHQRQAFVELQGLNAWHDKDISWNDRGTEHAAEIIAWGLGETSRPPRWIPNNDLDSLTTAYHQLTGTDPITDTTDEWQPGEPVF